MNNLIVGRTKELNILKEALASGQAEFIALYGRRRIGKTYLIKQFFGYQKNVLFFEQTGLHGGTLQEQLKLFAEALSKAFYQGAQMAIPKNWMEALRQLTNAMNNSPKDKRLILFFDELPWLATRKSGFLKALEHYWNTEWTYQKGLILIVCGSAASWMIDKLIYAKGGLHNRITVTIPLRPFNLQEMREYLSSLGHTFNNKQALQFYMVTGGVPHYLKAIRRSLSVTQNIEWLCFQKGGLLFDEFDKLFSSLFEEADFYIKIVRAIAKVAGGINREKLVASLRNVTDGGRLNTKLKSLEEAGFIAAFLPLGHARRGLHYRIIDEYVLFYLNWIETHRKKIPSAFIENSHYWSSIINTAPWYTWTGYAFEAVCFKHIGAIKNALGIQYIVSSYGDWRYVPHKDDDKEGTQIDLLFDREDDCVTLCEIKYTAKPFVITKEYALVLEKKRKIYIEQTKTKKQIVFALITSEGAKENHHYKNLIAQIVNLNDLFH